MAFMKVGIAPTTSRRLYLMHITMPSGVVLHKFGVASGSSSKDRLLQICGSIFDKFRQTPMIKLIRDREVPAEEVFKLESTLHKFFSSYRYDSPHKFDGVTECFVLPEDSGDAITAYELVITGEVPDFTYTVTASIKEDELQF